MELDEVALGKSLLVLGLAYFASGLVFLLPKSREVPSPQETLAEKIERTDYYLDQTRQERNTSPSNMLDDQE
jgi:hypothetical protein